MEKCETKDTVVIHQARYPEDFISLTGMVAEYASCGEIKIDEDVTRKSLVDMIYQGNVFIGKLNGEAVGAVAGREFNYLFSGDTAFCVMFLFVRREFGKHAKYFLKELELCLMATKYKTITVGIPSDEFDKDGPKLERYFQILGYKPLERHFYKRLCL